MWIVALLGMATAYAESALAQLYKVNDHHGLYRGGPAFYISRGLKSPWAGAVLWLSPSVSNAMSNASIRPACFAAGRFQKKKNTLNMARHGNSHL